MKVRLGDIAHIQTGPFGSQLHKSDYASEGTPVIMPQNIGDRALDLEGIARVGAHDTERLARHQTRVNDIVYARRGDVEKHAFIGLESAGALCGTGCLLVRPDDQKVNPLYLSFLLNNPKSRAWVRQHAVGSNMLNINTDILSALPLDVPDRKQQDAIASLLSAIDDKIANNKKLMNELEATARLIYDYWFTQFDFPDEAGNPYRSSGGTMVYNEILHREIPAGWEVTSLGDVCSFKNGVNYDKDSMTGKPCRIVNVRDISSSTFFINQAGLDEIELPDALVENYKIHAGDILIARSGTPGAVRLINKPEDTIFSGFIICCTPDKETLKHYLAFLLKQYEGTSATVTGGSILKNVSQDTLKRIQLVVPPIDTVDAFNGKIDKLLAQLVRTQEESIELASLRDWLLPMLMNGQVVLRERAAH